MKGSEIWQWRHGDLTLVPTLPTAPLAVADSWLVEAGRAVGLRRHERRFAATAGLDAAFFQSVRDRIPATGRWFPRLEHRAGQNYLVVRPAPELRTSTVLHLPQHPDPRSHPGIKGPDLAVLGAWRARAQAAGADDAVLFTPEGFVVEAANAVLAWWEGGRLMVPTAPGQLPSVTLAATVALGVPVGRRAITVPELRAQPVWAGSSLHGWTPVHGWVDEGGCRYPARAPSAAAINTRLWERAEGL